jgi:hypothetical protein
MGNTATCYRWINALGEQQRFASALMLVATLVEFLRLQYLACIMEHHGDPDKVRIVPDAQTLELRQEQLGSLADQANMDEQALWGAQLCEETAGLVDGFHAGSISLALGVRDSKA